ncbi:C-terminal binding protein [Fibrobacterota bacterium]
MPRKKIIVTDRLAPPADVELSVFGKKYDIQLLQATSETQILPAIKDADGLLVWHDVQITKKSLSLMKKCRVIVRVGVGFDNVDLAYAAKRNICVSHVPDYGVDDVADHTWAFVLGIYRNMDFFMKQVKRGAKGWTWEGANSKRLTGNIMGIVGLGRIGTAVAMRAKAFGVRIVFYDPYIPRGIEKSLGIERKETLKELLEISDIISFHTPLTNETKNMANKKFFALMKKGSVIVNTARGEIINSNDLYDAMKKKTVWAAGLDVLQVEPPPKDDQLANEWNKKNSWLKHRLLITPHCAFYSPQSFEEMRRKAAQEAKRVLEGFDPISSVNFQLF